MHTDGLITKYVGGVHDIHPTKDLTPLVIMNVAPTGMYIKGGDERFMTNGKPDWDKVVKHAKQGDGKLSVSNINSEMELITQIKVEKHFGFKTKQVLFNKPAQRYGAVIGGKLDVLVEQPETFQNTLPRTIGSCFVCLARAVQGGSGCKVNPRRLWHEVGSIAQSSWLFH